MSGADLPFLARRTFRRKRLGDASRLLPFVGAVLFAMPVFWGGGAAGRHPDTVASVFYLFLVWALLIVAAGVLSTILVRGDGDRPEAASDEGETGPETGTR